MKLLKGEHSFTSIFLTFIRNKAEAENPSLSGYESFESFAEMGKLSSFEELEQQVQEIPSESYNLSSKNDESLQSEETEQNPNLR